MLSTFMFAGINEHLNKGCISILYNELGIEISDKDYRYLRLEFSNFSVLQTVRNKLGIADSRYHPDHCWCQTQCSCVTAFELQLQEYNHHLLLKTYPTLSTKLIDMEKTAKHM